MGGRRRTPGQQEPHAGGPPRLAGHRVAGPIGFGSDGAVWAAQDPAGRDVVISVLPLASGSATVRRLAAMRHGTHPNLPRLRQVLSLDQHRCAVVSERVDGPTLATVVAARGRLEDGELAGVLAGVGSALGHLHERGVIHGDVSPANIVVTPAGEVVLVDLAGQVTRDLGTPGFVPPERSRGATAGAAGDVWALARVLQWAGGGTGAGGEGRAGAEVPRSRAAAVLAPALDPDPSRRPTARDFASGAPAIAAATAVRVPPPQVLAQARMRDASAPTQKRPDRRQAARGQTGRRQPDRAEPAAARASSALRVPTRHRRSQPPALSNRWLAAASVTGGALLVAGVLALAVPRAGEEPADSAVVPAAAATAPARDAGAAAVNPASAPPAPDLAVVTDLLARRDAALAARDPVELADTSLPGSAAAAEDAALLAELVAAEMVLDGLRIQASELAVVESGEFGSLVEVLLSQSSHARVVGSEREPVAARPAACARLELAVVDPGEWRLVRGEPCP